MYNGGFLSDIILLTQCYYHRGTWLLTAMKRFLLVVVPTYLYQALYSKDTSPAPSRSSQASLSPVELGFSIIITRVGGSVNGFIQERAA